MKFNSIQFKIVSIIILVLFVSVGGALILSLKTQRENLLSATQRTLSVNTQMLNTVIRNIMLSGEAPIARNTMNSLAVIQEFEEVAIYRTDGTTAFNDYSTIDYVNEYQDKVTFQRTERNERNMMENPSFNKVVKTSTPLQVELLDSREMEYYFPILNYGECRGCHGGTDFVRGVAHFRVSLEGIYRQIGQARQNLTIFFVITGAVIGLVLILMMNRIIIKPIFSIGETVKTVETGNLETSIRLKSKDELGDLAGKINNMISGLKEKNRLAVENRVFEARIEENRKYLDNILEGLLLLNRDLTISEQYSSFLLSLFGREDIAGMSFPDFIYPDKERFQEERKELEQFVGMIFNNTVSEIDMIMEINPLRDKTLLIPSTGEEIIIDTLFQRVFEGEVVENVMVIFEDKTRIVQVEKELEQEKSRSESEIQHIAAILRAGPQAFIDFIEEANGVLNEVEVNLTSLGSAGIVDRLFRQMHSLKGTARYLEFKKVETLSHQVEDIIAEVRDDGKEAEKGKIQRVRSLVAELYKEIEGIKTLNETFKRFSLAAVSPDGGLEQDPVGSFFMTLEKMAGDIGSELGKNIKLQIENNLETFPILPQLKNSIIHLVRNAIDHGIEDNFERLSRNKPEQGTITVKIDRDRDGTAYLVEVSDDGQGIDFDQIRKKAVEKGILDPGSQPADPGRLLKTLFSPRFSSKDEVSELSGRGVGLDVVKEAMDELHGKIAVATKRFKGTKFSLRIPGNLSPEGERVI